MNKKTKFTLFTDTFMPRFEADFAGKHMPKLTLKEDKGDETASDAKLRKAALQLRRVGLNEVATKMLAKKPFLGDLVRLATGAAEPVLKRKLEAMQKALQGLKKSKGSGKTKLKNKLDEIHLRLSEEVGEAKADDIMAGLKEE